MLLQHETVFIIHHDFLCIFSRFFFVYSYVVCRKRIKDMKKIQDEQFKTEIKNLEAMQQCAYDQMRFHRLVLRGGKSKSRLHRESGQRLRLQCEAPNECCA